MKYTRIAAASLALATLAACGGDASKTDSTALKNDSALAANLALANADSASKVSLGDTATGGGATKAPAVKVSSPPPRPATKTATKTTPAPRPATKTPTNTGGSSAGTSRIGVVDAGTSISLASNSKICTNTNAIGDNVTATTTEAISGTNGASIPAGATVNMTVTNLKRSDNVNDKIVMEFRVVSIEWAGKTHPVDASVTDADVERIRDQPKGKDVQKVAIGAAAGAIIGKIAGKSTKATVIGAAAGGAAGAATAAATANYQGCINPQARITVKLDAPLQIVVGL